MTLAPVFVTVCMKADSDFKPIKVGEAYDEVWSAVFPATTVFSTAADFPFKNFLEATFESGNVGALRDHLPRSLSVGDFIKIESSADSVAPLIAVIEGDGWSYRRAV